MSLSYQQSEYTIANGVQTFTVPFPVAFEAKPAVVIPVLACEGPTLLEGEPKYWLAVNLGAWDSEGFVVELSAATNRPDYKIVWMAGSFDAVFTVNTQIKKLSQLPRRTASLKSSDLIAVVDTAGNPVTQVMAVSDFLRNIVEIGAVPTSSIATDASKLIAIDASYLYTQFAGVWKKTARQAL